MKAIPLSNKIKSINTGKYIAIIDDVDFELVSNYNWSVSLSKRSTSYALTAIRKKGFNTYHSLPMHRLIMGLKQGNRKEVDHIDGNGLNNQRSNLRICTRQQNSFNRGTNAKSKTSSKYLGVHLTKRKDLQYWVAAIYKDGVRVFYKYFKTEMEAVVARDKAAIKFHGKFAKLNIQLEEEKEERQRVENEMNEAA